MQNSSFSAKVPEAIRQQGECEMRHSTSGPGWQSSEAALSNYPLAPQQALNMTTQIIAVSTDIILNKHNHSRIGKIVFCELH